MTLNHYFDQIRVVNLPERTDRRREMQTQLNRAGVRAEFFPAVRAVAAGDWPSAGAWGCFQSHYRILESALRAGARNVLIIEDDLDFVPEFKALEPEIVRQIASAEWDVLYLGHLGESADHRPIRLELTEKPLMTAYFYAVNARVLPRLVQFLNLVQMRPAGDPLGGPQHFDGAMCMFRAQNPDVRTLTVMPRLGHQRRSRSDISSAWYDRLPLAGGLINLARRMRRVLVPAA